MRYSTTNVQTSLTYHLTKYLREIGYDIRWHIDNHLDPHTSEGERLGEIRIVKGFPSNPTFIVRLNDSAGKPNEVIVPALSLQLIGGPRIGKRLGIGHSDFNRSRVVVVDGFADDSVQQKELADQLYAWVGRGDVTFSMWDYEADPENPPSLPDMTVDIKSIPPSVQWADFVGESDVVRHYIKLHFVLNYEE